jgi:hypothetical protein
MNHSQQQDTLSIAYFVSPHGFGHAARASAVMAALHALRPTMRFEIFTQVAPWFFAESLPGDFGYHTLLTDIGLVQENSLHENLPETVRRLDDFLPFDPQLITRLARQVNTLGCRLVLCDIAPMGIAVARAAGIPSVLIENFTWDWIYAGYPDPTGRMRQHMAYLTGIFAAADYHLQAEPVCRRQGVNLTAQPVARKFRAAPEQVRRNLGVSTRDKLVMLTMGGVGWDYSALEQLEKFEGVYFVIAGGQPHMESRGNLIILPQHSGFFHPDLTNACQAVIGKVGYSTLAEVYQAGARYGYVPRPAFRETAVLVEYIEANLPGLCITEKAFQSGAWRDQLPALLALPVASRRTTNGADQIAHFIDGLLG